VSRLEIFVVIFVVVCIIVLAGLLVDALRYLPETI